MFGKPLEAVIEKRNCCTAPAVMSPPNFLIICLENDYLFQKTFAGLLTALRANSELLKATSASMAIEYLHGSTDLAAVLVTDPSVIQPQFSNVAMEMVRYAKEGGTVIFGGLCSGFGDPNEFDEFFERALSLPWKLGSQYRTTFSFNPSVANDRFKKRPMPTSYNMKAVLVAGAPLESRVYVSTNESMIESFIFPIKRVTNHSESPVVLADFGRGHIGWIGDMNSEVASTDVILAMCNL